jgi:hypothetical protein
MRNASLTGGAAGVEHLDDARRRKEGRKEERVLHNADFPGLLLALVN